MLIHRSPIKSTWLGGAHLAADRTALKDSQLGTPHTFFKAQVNTQQYKSMQPSIHLALFP